MALFSGIAATGLGGAEAGALNWPMKLMRRYRFEQCWFAGMIFGLIVLPWAITLSRCPHALDAYRSVDPSVIVKSNLFSLAWGVGNILLGISLVRIGASLSFAVLSGVGIPLGAIVPMVLKGSGMFRAAPDLDSRAGIVILIATVLMLSGVVVVAFAGFGRDKVLGKSEGTGGKFFGGLVMCIVSGICSVGPSFAFVYCQEPIRSAMLERGAGQWPSAIAVWALGMLLGALANVVYPAILMTRARSWHVIGESPCEFALSLIVGLNLFLAFALWFFGMLLLGPIGGSVGFGIYFALQILGAQGLGWISGEWRGVHGRPIVHMCAGVTILTVAAAVMAYASTLAS
jgi:multidrug transporter EmrE-like cation transporter